MKQCRPNAFIRNTVKIVQINLGKRDQASTEIDLILKNNQFDIALIQEPCVDRKNNICNLQGHKYYKKTGTRPRTCIWLSNEYESTAKCVLMSEFSNQDITTVNLKVKKNNQKPSNIIISSFYMPHMEGERRIPDPITETLRALSKHAKQHTTDMILAGDSNAHHSLWGSQSNNLRGDKIIEFLASEDLDILNQGISPTWSADWSDPSGPATNIDISMSSIRLTTDIRNWMVSNIITESDHKAITFELKSAKQEVTKHRDKRRTNWKKYNTRLSKLLDYNEEANSATQLDIQAEKLHRIILEAFHSCCKLRNYKHTFKQKWFNRELHRLRTETAKKLLRVRKTRRPADSENYKNARKEYHKKIREAKKESWKKKTSEIEATKEVARLQKFFENGPRRKTETIRKHDGTFTKDLEESLEALMQSHFEGCEPITGDNQTEAEELQARAWDNETLKDISRTINRRTVSMAINHFSPFKAPGADEIFPALIQKGQSHIVSHLVRLFRASVMLGYIPKSWRGTKIAFIPKAGKTDYNEAKAYRPISLMSFILKSLEKILDNRIRRKELVENPMERSQHAYIAGKGTESALHEFITNVEKSFKYKEHCFSVFIDIAGAFDNTSTEDMLRSLDTFEVGEWIKGWIRGVKVRMSANSKEVKFVEY